MCGIDGGYSGEKFAQSVKELIGTEVQVAKRNELHPAHAGQLFHKGG
jgi:hypothetical protein